MKFINNSKVLTLNALLFIGVMAISMLQIADSAFAKEIKTDNNQKLNKQVSKAFDTSFEQKNAAAINELTEKLLPSLRKSPEKASVKISWKKVENKFGVSKIAILSNEDTSVTINQQGRFHIINNNERITLNNDDVSKTRWQNWKNEDRSLEEIREIIFGGRSLDPYPQKSWNDKEIISSNWPDMKTTLGPVELENSANSLFIDPSNTQIGAAYGIVPRGIITLNPNDSSITIAFQVENNGDKIDKSTNKPYNWGSWTILPLKLSEKGSADNPSELVAFLSKETSSLSDTDRLEHKWNNSKLNGKNVTILNPYNFDKAEAEKTFHTDTNWAILARKGSDTVILMRTIYKHQDQFQVYNGQPEYAELEATGPLVPKGEKSTVISKLDFINLQELPEVKFKQFGETNNFKQEVMRVTRVLEKGI